MDANYDILLIGSGLFNAIIANEAKKAGFKCLVIEKRQHIGGNIYDERVNDINIHKYGPHIFHTNDKEIWIYMNHLCEFNHFVNAPLAFYKGKIYNLPFNMNTFYQLWGVASPAEAEQILNQQRNLYTEDNIEAKALSLVGKDIYEILIKGYTEKQWGKKATELPSFIINRLPLRFTYDNNYFNDRYQGIPIHGYSHIIKKCFNGCDVYTGIDFIKNRHLLNRANITIYTGMIDEYFDYKYGELEYRSLRFEEELLETSNFQGNAIINYTDFNIPYTRIIEHKHFEFGTQINTIISREYSQKWKRGIDAYYPVNTDRNNILYEKYLSLAKMEEYLYFAGRLGSYTYYDMDKIIKYALKLFPEIVDKVKIIRNRI